MIAGCAQSPSGKLYGIDIGGQEAQGGMQQGQSEWWKHHIGHVFG